MKVAISYHLEDSPNVDRLKNMLKYTPDEYILIPDKMEEASNKSKMEAASLKMLDQVDALLYLQGDEDRRTQFVGAQLDFALERQIPIIPIKVGKESATLPDQIQDRPLTPFTEKKVKLEIWNQLKRAYD